jgi:4-azaleucine resistance transporter AzlC
MSAEVAIKSPELGPILSVMDWRTSIPRPSGDVRAALADTLPVGAGMVPLGVAFGVLVTQAGLAWWWTPVISGLVFAGSLEFLLLSLVIAAAPLATIALTTLLVNSRHVFYCLTFPLQRVRGRFGRLYSRFALTDEAYALTTALAAQGYSSRRILAMQVSMHGYWVGGGIVGALLGSVVPTLAGLDFALVGLFVVLAVDACRSGRDLAGALLAVLSAVTAGLVAPGEMLLLAMSLFVALLALSARLRSASPRLRPVRA